MCEQRPLVSVQGRSGVEPSLFSARKPDGRVSSLPERKTVHEPMREHKDDEVTIAGTVVKQLLTIFKRRCANVRGHC